MKLDSTKLAEMISQKLKEGKTLEEAILEIDVNVTTKTSKSKIEDRIVYIKGLTNIKEVRKASKAAFAKRSKAKTEEADDKYGQEIFAARDRLNELNKMIDEAEFPLQKAIELGEDESGIVQRSLDLFKDLDERVTRELKRIMMTRKEAKDLMKAIDPNQMPEELVTLYSSLGDPAPYIDIFKGRVLRNDQRVITLSRTLNFLKLDYFKSSGRVAKGMRELDQSNKLSDKKKAAK